MSGHPDLHLTHSSRNLDGAVGGHQGRFDLVAAHDDLKGKCPGDHPLGGRRRFAVGSAQAETGSLTVTALFISA